MKNPLIRTIYLYLFALAGLALLAIGVYRFVDLGLKTWVFKKAQALPYVSRPLSLGYDPEFTAMTSLKNCSEKCEFTPVQIAALDEWLKEYKEWEKNETEQLKFDYHSQAQHRTASESLALLLVGLPVYLYHWGLIRKDIKKNNKEE